jgi:hypothetical protein
MQHMPWDQALKVAGGGTGLVGRAGAILLRKSADQAGLTGWLGAALQKAGTSPVFGRGTAREVRPSRFGVGSWIERPFGRSRARMPGKAPERGGCDQVLVRPEAVHGHPVDWTLFRIEVLRAR